MKNLIGRILAALLILTAFSARADFPASYYSAINGLSGAELKTALFKIISDFTVPSDPSKPLDPYAKRYSSLPEYFRQTDVRIEDPNVWWDMYADLMVNVNINFGTYMNREHSFPKSWWGGDFTTKAYVDINHLYPSEKAANTAKSYWPLGEVASTSFDNGISKVGSPVSGQGGNASKVFEPADEYKGDFARTYFYMVTCYQNLNWSPTKMYMLQQNTYPTLKTWALDLLMKWHKEDPVEEKEILRNAAVYNIQNNRNPFIDMPELVDYIWGDKKNVPFYVPTSDTPTGDPELITPVQNMALDFGQTAIGNSTTADLLFRGNNLTGDLKLNIYAGDSKMFSIPTSAIPTSAVNTSAGYKLKVTYNPTELGMHEARLLVTGNGINLGVALRGECLAVPTLTKCTVLPPSDFTDNSYRANWTYPSNEVVDYWVVTRTRYLVDDVTVEEIEAEEPGLIIDGFEKDIKESYTVESVRLGYHSPVSDPMFVDWAGVTGVKVDEPLLVRGFDGFIRFICEAPQTTARVFDMTGKLVITIPEVSMNLDVEIPTGVYMVVTDQCSRPVKVIVR